MFFTLDLSLTSILLSTFVAAFFIAVDTLSIPPRRPSIKDISSNLSCPPNSPIHASSVFGTPSSSTFLTTLGNGATGTVVFAESEFPFGLESGRLSIETPNVSVVLFEDII